MKIKLKNENTIETRQSENVPIRSIRARLYNTKYTIWTWNNRRWEESYRIVYGKIRQILRRNTMLTGVSYLSSGKVSFFLNEYFKIETSRWYFISI